MKKSSLFILFLLFPFLANANLTADQIVEKQIATNKGYKSESAYGKMQIVGKNGKAITREFEMMQLEENGDQGYKAMIKVLRPNDLKDTGLLTHQYKDREDDQWLYLPALKKTRRISGSSRGGRFLGSDFTYEDLSPKKKEDYTYKLLRTEACGDQQCYVVEGLPKASDSNYAKVISWITTDTFNTKKMELYDSNQKLNKVLTFKNYKQYQTFWRPHKITMKDQQKNRHTILEFSDLKIGANMSEGDFTKKALER